MFKVEGITAKQNLKDNYTLKEKLLFKLVIDNLFLCIYNTKIKLTL